MTSFNFESSRDILSSYQVSDQFITLADFKQQN